jgi:hypothetical protein
VVTVRTAGKKYARAVFYNNGSPCILEKNKSLKIDHINSGIG